MMCKSVARRGERRVGPAGPVLRRSRVLVDGAGRAGSSGCVYGCATVVFSRWRSDHRGVSRGVACPQRMGRGRRTGTAWRLGSCARRRLWVGTFAIGRCASWAISLVAPDFVSAARAASIQGLLSWWAALAALAINPLFEEAFWLAYGVSTLRHSIGLRAAVLASITLRVLVHYIQGPHALISVLPVAVVFTLYYVRTGRLWPVIVAHVIINSFGFADFVSPTRS